MTLYCVDTSAWHHATDATVAAAWRRLLESDELALCDQVRLEILWSARSHVDYETLAYELRALHSIATDAELAETPPASLVPPARCNSKLLDDDFPWPARARRTAGERAGALGSIFMGSDQ